MEVKAHLKYLRISPRKVRLIIDIVRGMKVKEAQKQLEFKQKKATEPILKLLNSAIANAKNNFDLDENNLYISKIFVNEGPTLKRWRARAMGRSAMIKKRTSHITIILDELVPTPASKIKKRKIAKPKIIRGVKPEKEEPSEETGKKVTPTEKEEKPEEEPRARKRERFSKQQAARGFSRLGQKIFRRKSI